MKAVLVIDKAESCTSCLLGIFNKKWFCLATNKDIDITDRYRIPSWCPLKPLPERFDEVLIREQDGWNRCLDAIMGEKENVDS